MEPELLVMELPFRCAVSIRGTVISRHDDHMVVDVGRRVVGIEYGPPIPVGFASSSIAMSDEHATVKRLYRGLMTLRQAEDADVFDRKDRWSTHFSC